MLGCGAGGAGAEVTLVRRDQAGEREERGRMIEDRSCNLLK